MRRQVQLFKAPVPRHDVGPPAEDAEGEHVEVVVKGDVDDGRAGHLQREHQPGQPRAAGEERGPGAVVQ